jgi:hypothetical protein
MHDAGGAADNAAAGQATSYRRHTYHTSPYVYTHVLIYIYIYEYIYANMHTCAHMQVAVLTTQQQDKLGGLSEEMGETLVAAARLEAAKEELEEELEHSRAREQEAEQVGY